MATIILILLAIAPLYFAWEAIIAPSIRLYLRFRIFRIRDELRELKIAHGDAFSDDAFRYAQDSANTAIRLLPVITVSVMQEAKTAFHSNDALRAKVAKREALLDACEVPGVKVLLDQAFEFVWLSLLVNCAGLFLWVVPALLTLAWLGKCKSFVKELMIVPEHEIDQLFSLRPEPAVA